MTIKAMTKMTTYHKSGFGFYHYVDNENEMVVMADTSFAHQGSLWSGSDRCKEIMSLAYLVSNIMISVNTIIINHKQSSWYTYFNHLVILVILLNVTIIVINPK